MIFLRLFENCGKKFKENLKRKEKNIMGCAIQEIVNENPKPTKNDYNNHQQQMQTSNTLKSQHTALVKLLESAPITGSKSKTVTNYASLQHQQTVAMAAAVATATTKHQQLQQIKSSNDTSSIRISNNVINVCDVVSKTNSCLSNEDNDEDNMMMTMNSSSNRDDSDSSKVEKIKLINTKNQCPWKKIRYAREWKQRELLSDENVNISNLNEISKCDNTELNKRLIMDEQHQQQQQQQQNHLHTTPPPNHQQPDDITSQMQQQPQIQIHRRDSSDSNSSVASLSCTCNIPQDNEMVDEDCECQQDSGCNDGDNSSNGTMNYLCQKFNNVSLFFILFFFA